MRKIFIIAKREYLERVRAKSFLVMTLAIPALMYGMLFLPTLMLTKGSGGSKHLVVVASDTATGELIRHQLDELSHAQREQAAGPQATHDRNRPQVGRLTIDLDDNPSEAERTALTEKVKQKQLDGVIFATDDALAAKKVSFITRDVASVIITSEIQDAVNNALRRGLLKSKGMSETEIENALQPVSLDAESPSGPGNPQAVFFTVFFAAMVLYMSVLLYGVNVMRAILEEKTSRVMEVMLATAEAKHLMAGKILGVAAVGLTQIAIWAAMVLVPGGTFAAVSGAQGILSAKLLIYFAIFFLLGFALYSTLCAAVGAMVNSEQEGQQLQLVIMLPMIISVIIMVSAIENPSSPIAIGASIFPLTAPLLMFLRVAIAAPAPWEVAASIALMLVTTYGLVWLCSRIYRVGILMYGKRPTLPEIMKWIRYA